MTITNIIGLRSRKYSLNNKKMRGGETVNNKPLTVVIEDLRQSLIQCIVDSKLHLAIVKLVVDDVKRSVDQEYGRILKTEREVYAKSQNASTIVEQQVIPNEEFKNDPTNPVDNEGGT